MKRSVFLPNGRNLTFPDVVPGVRAVGVPILPVIRAQQGPAGAAAA